MAVLTRYTSNGAFGGPNIVPNQGQLGAFGYNSSGVRPSGDIVQPGGNAYTHAYGFDSEYGDYLLQGQLANPPIGGYLPGFNPISAGLYSNANVWDYKPTGQNTINAGHTNANGSGLGIGVTIAWDLGLKQATPGDPAWARNQMRNNDPAYGQANLDYMGQDYAQLLSKGTNAYGQPSYNSWQQRIEASIGTTNAFGEITPGRDSSVNPGQGWKAAPVEYVQHPVSGQWYKTLTEPSTKYGIPSMLGGNRYIPRDVATAAGYEAGLQTSPLFTSTAATYNSAASRLANTSSMNAGYQKQVAAGVSAGSSWDWASPVKSSTYTSTTNNSYTYSSAGSRNSSALSYFNDYRTYRGY